MTAPDVTGSEGSFKPKRAVSISELRTLRRCKRQWWLGYFRGLRPKLPEVAGPRALGTRVHAALEAYYQPGAARDPETAFTTLSRLFEQDQARLIERAKRDEEWSVFLEEAREGLRKDHSLAWIMLEGYFEWLAESGADQGLEVLTVEEIVVVPGPPFTRYALQGKLDKRVRREIDDAVMFVDHKTVGNLKDLPKTAHINEQGLMYTVLLKLAHPEERVDGLIFNMLRKVKRTARANPPFYARHEVRYNTHQLNSFYARVTGLLQELERMEWALEHGGNHQVVAPPTPSKDCSWDCDFVAVCAMFDDGSRVEAAIEEFYDQGDPYSYYGRVLTEGEGESE